MTVYGGGTQEEEEEDREREMNIFIVSRKLCAETITIKKNLNNQTRTTRHRPKQKIIFFIYYCICFLIDNFPSKYWETLALLFLHITSIVCLITKNQMVHLKKIMMGATK